MNQVKHILTRKGIAAVSVTPDTTVFEALKIMAEKNIGSVVVMENGIYLGIVTERDYSRKVTMPRYLPFSITTTEPMFFSAIIFSASKTVVSG